jgi:hypothetical protein
MNKIHTNPYRIAGILSNARAREVQRQRGKIKAFASAKKEITSEFDFNFLNKIERTEEIIGKAFSNIEQNQDKVNNSLFWFVNANPFDNTAIEYLKNGNSEKAQEIWSKVTNEKDVNSTNFSAFNNIGTLKLLSNSKSEIKEGIEAKIKLIESEYFENFVHSVADQTITIDNKKQSKLFIDSLLTQFKNQYSSADALDLFSNCSSSTQNYLSNKFTEEPLHNIESSIETTKKKRTKNKADAYSFGLKLFVNAKDDLTLLKSLLGTSDLKYKMIADNLAKEVMQCGIDYFQEWKESKDPSKDSLKLLKYAKSIAIGSQTKERVKENISGIEEWAVTAPIQDDLRFITNKLERFQNLSDTCSNAKDLVVFCKPKLRNMKIILGSTNELYLNISNAIVNNVQAMTVSAVNQAQEDASKNPINALYQQYGLGGDMDYSKLKGIIREALDVSFIIGKLDKTSELRTHYLKNHTALKSLAKQLDISTSSPEEVLEYKIRKMERELQSYPTKDFIPTKTRSAKEKMTEIKGFHLFRGRETKEKQIREQNKILNSLTIENESLRKKETTSLKRKITLKKNELKELSEL